MKKFELYDVPKISTLQEMIIQSASKYPDKIALEDLNTTPIPKVTYGQLLDNILKFGAALKKTGLKERSHIAVISENRVQWGITYLTAMVFNYVIVPIDKNLNTNEILNIIHESETEAIVFSESYEQMFREKMHSLKKLKLYISMDLESSKEDFLSMSDLILKTAHSGLKNIPKI